MGSGSPRVWCAVLVDGIVFAGRHAIVALGVDSLGRKTVLGLREGSTESSQVCVDLFQSLIKRGLDTGQPFFFVLDGGRGLRSAVKAVFGDHFLVQRCLVHKACNIREYLPGARHVEREFAGLWARFRRAENETEARRELAGLRQWLSTLSHEAVGSRSPCLLLGAAPLTHIAFSGPPGPRSDSGGRKRERDRELVCGRPTADSTGHELPTKGKKRPADQIQRWVAVALQEAERHGFCSRGSTEIPDFLIRMRKSALTAKSGAAMLAVG